ncbi:MAG: tetratricopeptide repeat protein [bacterium]
MVKQNFITFLVNMLLILWLLLLYNPEAINAQENVSDKDIQRYEEIIKHDQNNIEAYKKLVSLYAKKGMIDKAIAELDKAMDIKYREGYEDAIKEKSFKFYGTYLFLSVIIGLLISAIVVSILSWSEIVDGLRTLHSDIRVKRFIRHIKVKLSSDLKSRAIEIARNKERLRDAINHENDPSMKEITSGILPRLDDLIFQASLLLELQQNLSNCIKDIDLYKLEVSISDAEHSLREETDEEAKKAIEYQIKQLKNKHDNYIKAKAKIRTCDAVLRGIGAKIDATLLDLLNLPSVLIKKQEFFEKVSAELDEEIKISRDATDAVVEEIA